MSIAAYWYSLVCIFCGWRPLYPQRTALRLLAEHFAEKHGRVV